ncbi:MAG: aspartate carbamoyltransferase [Candidatus Berkelbacteria bacterium]|nr:aspartate carbamoyltransferase [Candidatus Berkelbacteria bacterium]
MDTGFLEKINGKFKGKDIVSLDQFTPKDIEILFSHIKKMRTIAMNAMSCDILAGKNVVLLFYEPSSRTRGSFDAATKQLGGQTIVVENPQQFSSVSKGENFEDTIRVFEAYSDLIVLRHPEEGASEKASKIAKFVPIINAGDGKGEHPTQALLDLCTIYEKFGRLENLTGVLVGDPLNSRAIHSLIRGLALYPKNTIYLLSPKELKLSKSDFQEFSSRKIKLIEIHDEKDMPKNADFWYWTRVQKERFEDQKAYEKIKDSFHLTKEFLNKYGNKNLIILDPLPRVGKIDMSVDDDPRAVYLTSQIRNGMYVRMALLGLMLGKL